MIVTQPETKGGLGGFTPLSVAVTYGQKDVAELLRRHGAH
jgi:ankyrin repeat protein